MAHKMLFLCKARTCITSRKNFLMHTTFYHIRHVKTQYSLAYSNTRRRRLLLPGLTPFLFLCVVVTCYYIFSGKVPVIRVGCNCMRKRSINLICYRIGTCVTFPPV
jgi:hypothetical protein